MGKKIVFLIYKQHIFLTKDLYAESVYQCMACKQLRRCEMLTAARGVCSNKSDLYNSQLAASDRRTDDN